MASESYRKDSYLGFARNEILSGEPYSILLNLEIIADLLPSTVPLIICAICSTVNFMQG
ncbi:MAG: hypothetical protein ACKOWQ_09845 [Aquirufa sp.]